MDTALLISNTRAKQFSATVDESRYLSAGGAVIGRR
jgi:hypothetical protein